MLHTLSLTFLTLNFVSYRCRKITIENWPWTSIDLVSLYFTFVAFVIINDENPQVIACSSNLNRSLSHVDSPTDPWATWIPKLKPFFAKKKSLQINDLFLNLTFIFADFSSTFRALRPLTISTWVSLVFQFLKLFPYLWIAPVWELSVSIIGRNDKVE